MTAANPMKGEAALGDKMLRVDFNGLCALERATGLKVPALLKVAEEGLGFDDLRTWVRVFLTDGLTDEETGSLLNEVGYQAGIVAISEALDGFFSTPKKEKAKNPLKAA